MKTVKIKDLGRTVTGHTPPTSESKYFGDYMPFVKPTDIDKESKYTYNPEQYYSEEAAEKYKTSLIPKGATCVVCIGTIGEKMTMAHCDLYTNQSINSIIPSVDFDPDYVYYLLKYNLGKVKALNKGTASGREFVSKSTFLEMEVQIHENVDKQKQIGSLLSAYDSLIENNQKQIKLLEEGAERQFYEWFVKAEDTSSGWTEKGMLDVYDFKYGKILPTASFVDNGPIPVYGASKKIGRYIQGNCFEPKVLVGSRGNAGFVHRTYESVSYVTNNSFIINPLPAYSYIKLPYTFELFKYLDFAKICTGSAQPQLTLNTVASVKFLLPPKDLIEHYCSLTDSCFKRISISYEQIEKLIKTRNNLMQMLFSGELIV